MKLSSEQLDEIIENLRGTCMSDLDSELEKLDLTTDDLTEDQIKHFDSSIFLCTECGWWYDMEEYVGEIDGECTECTEDCQND